MWSFPDLDSLVLGLPPQQGECPAYGLVECLRLNIFERLDPVPPIQEIAAGNAHSRPPQETLG